MAAEEKINRSKAEKLCDKGHEYRKAKDYEDAIKTFKEAIELDKSFSRSWRGLGWVYWDLEDYQKIISLLSESLEHIQDVEIYSDLGDAHAKLKQSDEALTFYKKSLEINPTHPPLI